MCVLGGELYFWSLFCCVVMFCNHLADVKRAIVFTLIVFLLPCECLCFVLFLEVHWMFLWSVIVAFPIHLNCFVLTLKPKFIKEFPKQSYQFHKT